VHYLTQTKNRCNLNTLRFSGGPRDGLIINLVVTDGVSVYADADILPPRSIEDEVDEGGIYLLTEDQDTYVWCDGEPD